MGAAKSALYFSNDVINYAIVIRTDAAMQSKERRAQEKAQLRARILEAARYLFIRKGYEAVTMREVAARIGYTATALYYHFPDKESLLRELCELDFEALSAYFKRLGRISDPIERIRKTGQAYVNFGLEYPEHYRLMFMVRHPDPPAEQLRIEKGNPDQDAYAFLLRAVEEAMAAGRLLPQLKDPELVAQALWGCVHGLVALHLNKMEGDWVTWRSPAKAAQLITGALLDGLLCPSTRR
jgi:AcrR family transcriptional regulator